MPAKSKDAPKKGETTRLAIEDAAVELFMEHGYHATSMRQIAEHAGLALGGIYNHFASKDELFEAIIVDKHPYKQVLPAILLAEGESAEEFLRNAAYIIFSELDHRPDYIKLMLIEMIEFNGAHGAKMIKEVFPKVFPTFERLVKSRKSLRVSNPAVLLRSFFGMILSFYITGIVVNNSVIAKLLPTNNADAYVDIFLHGIIKPEN
jgi:TetR/AcrR family transcriptional regulator, mexJK operon transcriptional repressor